MSTRGVINYMDRDFVSNFTGTLEAFTENRERSSVRMKAFEVSIEDARGFRNACSLERQGFTLVDHESAIADFEDVEEVQRLYPGEIEQLLMEVTRASKVVVFPSFLLRFGERSPKAGSLVNSLPGRFAHSDYSESSARLFGRSGAAQRFAAFNIWRVLTPPPQDIPLAVCDARSVACTDHVIADSVIDPPDQPELRFETTWFFHSPAHRWHYFRDMTRDEVLIWRAYDADPSRPQFVPHSAFDDPSCPAGVPTRVSVEARAFAYF